MLTQTAKNKLKRDSKSGKIKAFLKGIGSNTSDTEAMRLLLRDKAKKDFWFFQHHIYGNADTYTQLHIDMANRWQRRSQSRFSLWLIPRSHLKTSLWTEAGTLWELIKNPDQRFLIVNAKLENAIAIVSNIKNCISTNEIFRWLFPEYCPDLVSPSIRKRCKWLTDRVDLPCSKYAGRKEGNIEAMGVEASLVSKHYDVLVFDDPVNDVNTTTKNYRDKIFQWYKNALQLRHDANSRIRLIGTRWHFDDLYSRIIKAERKRRKQAENAGEKVKPRYWIYHRQVVERVDTGGEVICGYDDTLPIWPERFNKESIEEIRDENGSYIFSCQYMNNPLPEENAVFKYSDIKVVDEYDIPDNLTYFIATDTAVDETEDGDWWVITVAGFDSLGRMFVREVIRDKLVTSSFLQHVHGLTKKWKPLRVSVETVAYQTTLYKNYREWAVRANAQIPWVELKRGRKNKRQRIMALQPRVERGDFHVEEDIKNIDWLIEEMTTFPKVVNDDIIDTLADLESIFYGVSDLVEVPKPLDTFDAVYGSLTDELDYEDESFECEVISEAM